MSLEARRRLLSTLNWSTPAESRKVDSDIRAALCAVIGPARRSAPGLDGGDHPQTGAL
jgi:hypothetical protein